jgi:hypothetical protein
MIVHAFSHHAQQGRMAVAVTAPVRVAGSASSPSIISSLEFGKMQTGAVVIGVFDQICAHRLDRDSGTDRFGARWSRMSVLAVRLRGKICLRILFAFL